MKTMKAVEAKTRNTMPPVVMMISVKPDGSMLARPERRLLDLSQSVSWHHTGVWSEGLSQPRGVLSMPEPARRSAACGDSSR